MCSLGPLGEKGKAGAIKRPLGALPLSAVGEAGERIFGEDGVVITAALRVVRTSLEKVYNCSPSLAVLHFLLYEGTYC